uniref:GATA-type domain-containing protein n=1 Tax=Heterorhabditis bacteriophora TaxID=37862 RepID=A0A1I7X4K8_HETBA
MKNAKHSGCRWNNTLPQLFLDQYFSKLLKSIYCLLHLIDYISAPVLQKQFLVNRWPHCHRLTSKHLVPLSCCIPRNTERTHPCTIVHPVQTVPRRRLAHGGETTRERQNASKSNECEQCQKKWERRRHKDDACNLYFRKNRRKRPLTLRKDVIAKRYRNRHHEAKMSQTFDKQEKFEQSGIIQEGKNDQAVSDLQSVIPATVYYQITSQLMRPTAYRTTAPSFPSSTRHTITNQAMNSINHNFVAIHPPSTIMPHDEVILQSLPYIINKI